MLIKDQIIQTLQNALHPSFLEVIDDSSKHKGHLENEDVETHFKIKITSESLAHKTRIESHRIIYDLIRQNIKKEIHSISIKIIN
jgi:BolA family transcriptional regulator, general stress-responsive regulator